MNSSSSSKSTDLYLFPHQDPATWPSKRAHLLSISEAPTLDSLFTLLTDCSARVFGGDKLPPIGILSMATDEKAYLKAEKIDVLHLMRAIAKVAIEVEEVFPSPVTLLGTDDTG